jgi:hypothetical protein
LKLEEIFEMKKERLKPWLVLFLKYQFPSEGPEISFFKLFVTIETVDKRIKQIKVTVDV